MEEEFEELGDEDGLAEETPSCWAMGGSLALLAGVVTFVLLVITHSTQGSEWAARLAEEKAAREALSQVQWLSYVETRDGTVLKVIIKRGASDAYMALACQGKTPAHKLVREFATAGVRPIPEGRQAAAAARWERQDPSECEAP